MVVWSGLSTHPGVLEVRHGSPTPGKPTAPFLLKCDALALRVCVVLMTRPQGEGGLLVALTLEHCPVDETDFCRPSAEKPCLSLSEEVARTRGDG